MYINLGDHSEHEDNYRRMKEYIQVYTNKSKSALVVCDSETYSHIQKSSVPITGDLTSFQYISYIIKITYVDDNIYQLIL